MLSVGAHVRFLQNHTGLVESLFAIKHQGFRLTCEIHSEHLAGAAKHNRLAVGSPSAPCGVVHHLASIFTRNVDHPQVPLFRIVGIIFGNPATLAAVKEHRRSIGRNAREPVHVVAIRKSMRIRTVCIHHPDIVMTVGAARGPDNGTFKLTLESIKRLLFLGSRVNGGTRRSPLLGKSSRESQQSGNRKLHHVHINLKKGFVPRRTDHTILRNLVKCL